MLHSEYHNHNPKIKQTRQFFPSPEQFDFWGYVFVTYHPRKEHVNMLVFFLKFCREACSFGTLVLIDFIVLSAQHSYLSYEILPGNTFIQPTLLFGTQE